MKVRLLLAITVLAIGFAVPVLAQEQNTVDPGVRQQIEAALTKFDEAFNKNDATATAALFTLDAAEVWSESSAGGWLSVNKPSRKGMQPTSHRIPASCPTSLFRCMRSANHR